VLDVGTCDGFWAFEMERRGAAEVVATDLDSLADYDVPRQKRDLIVDRGEETLAEVGLQPVGSGFKLAHELLGSKVKREIVNVYELSPEKVGTFDIVFVGYLLVHLRDPQTALENIFSVARDKVVVVEPVARDLEGLDRPVSSYVGTSYLGIWWEHNTRSWELMMHTAGFERIEEAARAELDFKLGPGQDVTMSTVALRGRVPRTAK
jgi:tRNA (mo5U34)-methyltransferase